MVAAALRTAQVVQVVQVDSSPEAVLLAAAWAWRQSSSLCPDDIYEERCQSVLLLLRDWHVR